MDERQGLFAEKSFFWSEIDGKRFGLDDMRYLPEADVEAIGESFVPLGSDNHEPIVTAEGFNVEVVKVGENEFGEETWARE